MRNVPKEHSALKNIIQYARHQRFDQNEFVYCSLPFNCCRKIIRNAMTDDIQAERITLTLY